MKKDMTAGHVLGWLKSINAMVLLLLF